MSIGTITQEAVLKGGISPQLNLSGLVIIPTVAPPETEEKSVTPSSEVQVITPSQGKFLSKVTVGKIPNNYGLITYNGYELTVS